MRDEFAGGWICLDDVEFEGIGSHVDSGVEVVRFWKEWRNGNGDGGHDGRIEIGWIMHSFLSFLIQNRDV